MTASDQHKIIADMTTAVPPGAESVDTASREVLGDYTKRLLEVSDVDEYERYRDIKSRNLGTEQVREAARPWYAGRRVLVTGGAGCIGSTLLRELREFDPATLFSIDLPPIEFDELRDEVPGVVYLQLDLADRVATQHCLREIRPDVIFHCAAQRSPWLAEREPARTLLSNVAGTDNLLRSARDVRVERFVHASTGKAMRYYTSDIYAASKKLDEWLVHDYAREGNAVGLARFTHVVDNAVVIQKVDEAVESPAGVMRVHDPDMFFYAQSALESAQLLLLAGLDPTPSLSGLAIRDLGAPVELVQLVLGRMLDRGATRDPAVYFSGFDKGYERGNPPGLYDPTNAADFSSLINAVEAAGARPLEDFPAVDRFAITLPRQGSQSSVLARRIRGVCQRGTPIDIRAELARAAAVQADTFFRQCPEPLFTRIDAMAHRGQVELPTTRVPAQAA